MSDTCAELKQLIRFDLKTAISTSKEKIKWLEKKYSDSSSFSIFKAAQLRSDAELLKWCAKALLYEPDGIFALN